MLRLFITADDRSGAMEAAALVADAGLHSVVVSWDGDVAPTPAECVVVDLRSRHLAGDRAIDRVERTVRAAAVADSAVWCHKIDSTLRGNWAVELAALAAAVPGRRVLVVPAHPEAGRTCRSGVVRLDGVPVAETEYGTDAASPTTTSEPAHRLGAQVVSGASLTSWLARGASWAAVADAETLEDIDAAVRAAAGCPDVLVAGPAPVIGAVARRLAGPNLDVNERVPAVLRPSSVLVVCGSRHPASRAQAAALAGRPDTTVLVAPDSVGSDPEVIALTLATRAHDHVAAHAPDLVVLLGGDTTDAFVGERVVRVEGSVGIGMAYGSIDVNGRTISLISKPGGFGAADALARLFDGTSG